jgi:hypothetical protein
MDRLAMMVAETVENTNGEITHVEQVDALASAPRLINYCSLFLQEADPGVQLDDAALIAVCELVADAMIRQHRYEQTAIKTVRAVADLAGKQPPS